MSMKGLFLGCLKCLMIFIGLCAVGFLSALITINIAMQSEQIKVPTIVGKDIVPALKELNTQKLNFKIEKEEFHHYFPQNTIISQKPKAGSVVKSGRTIRVILSLGTQMVQIPDVCRRPWLQAQTILQENGLRTGFFTKIHHDRIGKNIVISQDPPPGDSIQRKGIVNLLISEGKKPRDYFMPAVIGKKIPEAKRIIQDLSLKIGGLHHEYIEGAEPNTVIEQFPKAGHRVSHEDEVSLTVSREKSIDKEISTYRILHYIVPEGSQSKIVKIKEGTEAQRHKGIKAETPNKKNGNSYIVKIMLRDGFEENEIFQEEKRPGDTIELLVKTTSQTTALIYLDGTLVKEEKF